MFLKPAQDLRRALALLAAAAVCAALADRAARPERKLAWSGWSPPAAGPAPAANPVPPPAPSPPGAVPAPPAPAPAAPPARPGTAANPAPPAARPPVPPAARPAPAPPLAAQPRVGAARFAPAPDAVIRDLSSEDAWAAYQLKAPFLDARRSSEYQEGHVAGAWSVPIWEADAAARITEFEARADPSPGTPIVVYCSGGDCEDSRLLAQRLVQLGYRNLFIYRDGFPDWARRGRPQAPGARP